MERHRDLEEHLNDWAGTDGSRQQVAATVLAIANTCCGISRLIARGPLVGALGGVVGNNSDGDQQKELDVRTNDLLIAALIGAPVAYLASEENDEAIVLDPRAPLAVAIDPLDGSSNIDTNASVGTIFSILPVATAANGSANSAFFQPGRNQLAAGFVIYGPQTQMAFSVGAGTHVATLDPASGRFVVTATNRRVVTGTREFAINASNYRFWSPAVRAFVDDCIAGSEGPRGTDYNMRWNASLVAEAFRILVRGGVFLYPADARKGYGEGRLRLVYEAHPVAMLIEQAGGKATDGRTPILDKIAQRLHQRTPLVFGAIDEVERIARYKTSPSPVGLTNPLFGRRGLFRN